MPRFALLRHEKPDSVHWDFFLEIDETLKTWSLPEPPQHGREVACTAKGDHRLLYLEYEGPLSDDRGTVARWDEGTYKPQVRSEREWLVTLCGQWLRGRVTLRRPPDGPDASDAWSFLFEALP